MIPATDIITAVDAIATFYKPLSIRLFGSYAYGTTTVDSDVDFLVLKNFTGTPHEQFVKIRTSVDFPFPIDLLVRRPDVVRQRIKWNDFFLKEIMEQGIVLYAANDSRMGGQVLRRLRRRLAVAKVAQSESIRSGPLSLPAAH